MQNNANKTLHRDNYEVPKGEEGVVHYLKAMVDSAGNRMEDPILVKTGVKQFASVKRNLELQGNRIEILYHPNKEYTSDLIPTTKAEAIAEVTAKKDAEISEKDALIAELQRQLAEKNGETEETPAEKAEETPAKKGKGKTK